MSSEAPVGVFDSGVGGLSVLREIRARLPGESLLYVADSGHVPYGEKSPEFIRERCRRIADFFLEQRAKALVLACNTATAAAVAELRATRRWTARATLGVYHDLRDEPMEVLPSVDGTPLRAERSLDTVMASVRSLAPHGFTTFVLHAREDPAHR